MFMNGVSENVQTLSMRTDVLFTNHDDYTITYISTANQRDEYERTNYPNGVWIVRLETKYPVTARNQPSEGWTISEDSKKKYGLNGPIKLNLGRFRSGEMARKFILNRCTPKEIPVRRYDKICDCLAWQYPFEYRLTKNLTWECCANCGSPTKEVFRTPLNAFFDADFDLDAFLGL